MKRLSFLVLICLLCRAIVGAEPAPQVRVLHSAESGATATGNVLDVLGYGTVGLQVVIASAWDGTLTFQVSNDGSNYAGILCRVSTTAALALTTAAADAAVACPVGGFKYFKAPISSRSTGSVTVTASLVAGSLMAQGPATVGGLGTFTSAELATALTNETGTAGSAVFSTSPTLTTPTITIAGDSVTARMTGLTLTRSDAGQAPSLRAFDVLFTDTLGLTMLNAISSERADPLANWYGSLVFYVNSTNSSKSSITDLTEFLRLDGVNSRATFSRPVALTATATTGTVPAQLVYTGAAHTALTASTERFDVQWNSARTEQWATGALALQRFHIWQAPTLGFVGASTVTSTCTVCISGAPISGTNATLSATHGILVEAGAVTAATAAYGLTVNAPTGGSVNYAAQFIGTVNLPSTNFLLFGAASSSGAILRYNNSTGEIIVRRGDDATFGAYVSGSAANKLVGVTTLTTLTGDVATGSNTVGQSLTVTAPTGTGTGNLGTIPLKASTGKQVSGSSAHATSTLLTIGNTQTAHPGTAGALIHASAVTWTDFNTANSGTAAVASAYVFAQPTFAATGTSVTTTKAATVSILDAPTNGTNMTLSTSFALDVVAGAVRIGDLGSTGAATGKTQVCSDSTGKLFRSASGYSCETTNTGPGTVMELIYCGQAAENGTIYLSPAAGINGATIGARPELASATCDALDGATESTQDIIIFPQNAFRVTGMYCMQNGAEVLAGGETMIFTYRANAANVTPSVTCTISAAQTGCASAVVTTTDVAANLPTAMQLVMSSNNSDQDAWCSVSILVQP